MNPNDTFYVLSNNKDYVQAKFLPNPAATSDTNAFAIDPNPQDSSKNPLLQIYQRSASGDMVPVSNANPNNFLIVPVSFSISAVEDLARSVQISETMPSDFGDITVTGP